MLNKTMHKTRLTQNMKANANGVDGVGVYCHHLVCIRVY